MHFSLILTTAGRSSELQPLLDSLCSQTHQDFDLLVIDQNTDGRLSPILAPYQTCFSLQHIPSQKMGHSTGINEGLAHAVGELVAFPDDDCWYSPDVLAKVNQIFEENPELGGVTGRENTGKWDTEPGLVTRTNIWRRHISFTMFFRLEAIQDLSFDEAMGVGAGTQWGAGEETDFLLRVIERSRVLYHPSLIVFHPQWAQAPYTRKKLAKARSYGMGSGHVLRLHSFPASFVLLQFLRPLVGMCLSLLSLRPQKARFQWAFFEGRLLGWLRTPKATPFFVPDPS